MQLTSFMQFIQYAINQYRLYQDDFTANEGATIEKTSTSKMLNYIMSW